MGTKAISNADFKGKKGSMLSTSIMNKDIMCEVILLGTEDIDTKTEQPSDMYSLGGKVLNKITLSNSNCIISTELFDGDDNNLLYIASGMLQKDYIFKKYFTTEKSKKASENKVESITICSN